MSIDLPFNFEPRSYQQNFLYEVQEAIEGRSQKRYFYQIWHRRSGKDKVNIADIVPSRLIQDTCLVKYVFPTLVMGRDNMWDGIGSDGFKYIDHIPEEIRIKDRQKKALNESRMRIQTVNGSLFQIDGSDRPDKLRGGNPKLYIFSEWAEQDPYAWDVVEPILRENDGIAIFNTTPKGDNHARAMLEYAKNNPLWYTELLTAEDTGIWSARQLEDIRQDIIKRFSANGRSETEALVYFEQEYMCSFKSPVIGSYYGEGVTKAEKEGRVTSVPYMQNLPVDTAWDLGIDDSMTIWFIQAVGQEIHLIDYYENTGEGFPHYAQVLQDKRYLYGRHFAPHDIAVRELGTGKSRIETAHNLGINFVVGANLPIEDGINAARQIFSQCWFDRDKAYRGVNALKNYRKEWDEKNKVFRNNPKHDWASHGADGFRTFAINYKKYVQPNPPQTDFGGVKPYMDGLI